MDLNEDFQPTWYDRRCRRRKSIRHLGQLTLGAYGDQPHALAANRGAIVCYLWRRHFMGRGCEGGAFMVMSTCEPLHVLAKEE